MHADIRKGLATARFGPPVETAMSRSVDPSQNTASVGSRLDYCNSVLVGVTGKLMHRLQVMQNQPINQSPEFL